MPIRSSIVVVEVLLERAVPDEHVDTTVVGAAGPCIDHRARPVTMQRDRAQVVVELLGLGRSCNRRYGSADDRSGRDGP